MKHVSSLTAIALVLGTTAFAETAPSVSGVMSLEANLGNIGPSGANVDTQGFNVNADLDVQFSDNMSIGFVFAHRETTFQFGDGVNPTFEVTRWGIEPKYTYDSNAFAGLYYQDFTFGAEGMSIGLNSVGLFGGYAAQNYSIEVYTGQTKTDGMFMAPVEIEATNFGVSGSFQASDELELFGHYSLGDVSNWEGPSGNNTLIGAGFDYQASSSVSLYGAVTSYDIMDAADPITQVALGIGADLGSMGVDLPGMVTADWTHTDNGFGDVGSDSFAVGWTFSFGGSDAKPQNCVVNNARGGNRAPLAATFECIEIGLPS